MQQLNQGPRPMPAILRWLIASASVFFGAVALAVAVGAIPLEPDNLHAPLWIIGTCGVAFTSIGLVVALEGVERLQRLKIWLGFVFLLSFAAAFNWIAFGPGDRNFTQRTTFYFGGDAMSTAADGSELTGRIVFGAFALLVNLLIASPLLTAAWRRLRRSRRADS